MLDDRGNVGETGAVVILAGKVQLVLGQLVTTVQGNQALGIDQPDHLASLILSHAVVVHKVGSQLLGNTDGGGTGAKEENLVFLGRDTSQVDGVHESSQDDSASSLNIVVEAEVGGLVLVEELEGVLRRKVLELDQHLGVKGSQGLDDGIDKGEELVVADTLLAQSQVKLIVELGLVVGAEIESDGDGASGVNTGTGDVELKLSDRDTHAADTKITEAENARAIGDDSDLRSKAGVLRVWAVVLDDLGQVGEVVDGEEQTVGLAGRGEEGVDT